MSPTEFSQAADLTTLVEPACALAQRWLAETRGTSTRAERQASARLAALVSDPAGLDLAVRFVDRVARPESHRVAARELSRLTAGSGGFLSPADKVLLSAGAIAAPVLPAVVVPLARLRLRQLIGHLIVDADGATLTKHLHSARQQGFRLNLNLLGEAVLGEQEAAARLERTRRLLARPDVDYVSIKVSALASQISPWDIDGTIHRVADRLRELFRTAAAKKAFVNLDMEEYKDLDLTVAVFTTLLAEPEFHDVSAGLAIQAYLPDARGALEQVLEFARRRGETGGAPVKVRLVKGANLSMERVDAEIHGWAQAPYATKEEVDANYLALVDRALSADHGPAFRVGVASHNLYDVALAYLLSRGRGVSDQLDVEMLQGMAPAKARAVRDTVGTVILYTPVVARSDFDVAVAYLIRRLEENAEPQNFLYSLFAGDLTDQEVRFRKSVEQMRTVPQVRQRTHERPPSPPRFENATDSDPALEEVREWAAACVAARPTEPSSDRPADAAAIDALVARGRTAGESWAKVPPHVRAGVLRKAADALEARRGEFLTAMAAEAGKTAAEADPEVSEAVDFARWYADRSEDLDPASPNAHPMLHDGLDFTPHRLVLVTPPWNFPVAIPAGGMIAALAAGAAVIAKPAGPVPRCSEIVVEALHEAGIPSDAMQIVRVDEGSLGRTLVAHPGIDTVILTGASDTARMFMDWRKDRPGGCGVLGETSGKNALVITASADYDLAVADLVRSAFGHAGQKCSAASLAILVGEVGRSERFRRQLLDAVTSLRVGWPDDLNATMGPVIEEPRAKLARGLGQLEPGEHWLIRPRQLDDTGRLWSPGVRENVEPGSWFHQTECFGPVLGIMRAKDLDEALAWQNQVAYGLTGGLHSLDEEEIDYWLDRVEVGNAYVNRQITGAIVRRQPFGGWKASVVGAGAKAGGPDYVMQFGLWTETGLPKLGAEPVPAVAAELNDYLTLITDPAERDWLVAAARSDAHAWAAELGHASDLTGLRVEENSLRRRPAPLTIRALEGARLVEVLRVVLAASVAGTPVRLSLTPELSAAVHAVPDSPGRGRLSALQTKPVGDREFVARFDAAERVRLIGPDAHAVADQLVEPGVMVLAEPVLANGRRELLSVVREQAISRTRHRHGHLPRH